LFRFSIDAHEGPHRSTKLTQDEQRTQVHMQKHTT